MRGHTNSDMAKRRDGGEETVAFVRSWGHGADLAERTEIIRYAWQQLSTILQTGNAEMILSALG